MLFAGAITRATINLFANDQQLLDRSRLQLVLEGVTTGAQATSVTWRRNGSMISNVVHVFFIGGGETLHTGNPPCADQMYRVAIQMNGYLPGSYTYTVDNADTTDPGFISPVFEVQGTHFDFIT